MTRRLEAFIFQPADFISDKVFVLPDGQKVVASALPILCRHHTLAAASFQGSGIALTKMNRGQGNVFGVRRSFRDSDAGSGDE